MKTKVLFTIMFSVVLIMIFSNSNSIAEEALGNGICGDYKYEYYSDGTACIVNYYGDENEVIIPDIIDGYSVTAICGGAFSLSRLSAVTIPDSVITIWANPFYFCDNLQQINVSPEHPSLVVIDGVLFDKNEKRLISYINTSTEEYFIPDGTEIIGAASFFDCEWLTAIAIPDSVTFIEAQAFGSNYSLESITIPNSVLSIGDEAFQYCFSLTNVVIPDSVTTIGDCAFRSCNEMADITIPNSVTTVGINPFIDCEKLQHISVMSDHPNLEVINGVLFDKLQKKLITYPLTLDANEYEIPYGTRIVGDYAFSNCDTLSKVVIPDSVVLIGGGAFSNCWRLAAITIPKSVTEIGEWAFSDCLSLYAVSVPTNMTMSGQHTFSRCDNIVYEYEILGDNTICINKYRGKETELRIPTEIDGYRVSVIGQNSFFGCKTVTDIIIPDGVTSIGSNAFEYCSSLETITIPNSVITIGTNPFSSCRNLQHINIAFDHPTSKIVDGILFEKSEMRLIFCPCMIFFDEYVIPEGTKVIDDFAFSGCKALASVIIPESVKTIGDFAFEFCFSLKNISIPESINSIGICVFEGCSSLSTIVIPNSVTIIDNGAFFDCTSLNNIIIPDKVTIIGEIAFDNCSSLDSIYIPEGVTTICDEAFCDCASLKTIIIPKSITSLGRDVFAGCPNLIVIVYHDTLAEQYCKDNNIAYGYAD